MTLLAFWPHYMASCWLTGPMAPRWLPTYQATHKLFGSLAPVGFLTTWYLAGFMYMLLMGRLWLQWVGQS